MFAAGIELRQKPHQDFLMATLNTRIAETGCYGVKFVRDGLRFAYMKLEGMRSGSFIKIKEGAASRYVPRFLTTYLPSFFFLKLTQLPSPLYII